MNPECPNFLVTMDPNIVFCVSAFLMSLALSSCILAACVKEENINTRILSVLRASSLTSKELAVLLKVPKPEITDRLYILLSKKKVRRNFTTKIPLWSA
jgi:hypothetical protein